LFGFDTDMYFTGSEDLLRQDISQLLFYFAFGLLEILDG